MHWRCFRLARVPECPGVTATGSHSTAQAFYGSSTRRNTRILDIELFPFRDGFEGLLPARRLLRSGVSAEQNSQLETGFSAQIAFRAVAQQADSAFQFPRIVWDFGWKRWRLVHVDTSVARIVTVSLPKALWRYRSEDCLEMIVLDRGDRNTFLLLSPK